MPHRIKTLFLLLTDNWPYVCGWFVISFNWVSEIPEPVVKVLVAILTGFSLAFGKWCWEWVQKRFRL